MRPLVIILALAIANAQAIAQDLKHWDRTDAPEWKDFRGSVPERPLHDAYTAYRILANYAVNEERAVTWTVDCAFDRDRSWAKPAVRGSAVLLQHERLHFDIAEVHARSLREKLAAGAVPADERAQQALKAVLDSTMAQCRRDQDRYDKESDHGRDTVAGARWDADVRARLSALAHLARRSRAGR